MTYHGGVEDGMSAACARILRIVRDQSLPDEDKLDMITQYCQNVVKEPTIHAGGFKHASPRCACGVNEANEVFVDPICLRRNGYRTGNV